MSYKYFVNITPLGQVGFRFIINNITIYIDPYLSNSVQEKEDATLARLRPIPIQPNQVKDADYILITHHHRDHCDNDTLEPLAKASPNATFVCPPNVFQHLVEMEIDPERLIIIRDKPLFLQNKLIIYPVPAAHPDVVEDSKGGWQCIGYVIESDGRRIYHAGDTSIVQELIDVLYSIGKIDIAFLPVNERNYYREKKGIIGNMSVRDAFQLAEELKVDILVPTHWDMFAANQVYQEEIELIYNKMKPPFRLLINPKKI